MFDKMMDINGFEVRARYTRRTVEHVLMPLAERLAELREHAGRPVTALLAAPPGAGKSTLVNALCDIALHSGHAFTPLGLDGFHYTNAYLDSHFTPDGQPLRSVKGAPCTYDLPRLRAALEQLRTGRACWPRYDRMLHNPAPHVPRVSGEIFLVEGNWMLLNAPGWRELKALCDLSVAIDAPEELLLPRLTERKVRGGMAPEQARAFCERSDLNNIRLYTAHRLPADIELAEFEHGGAVEFEWIGRETMV